MASPFESLAHPLVIAHRGSMILRPENTLSAFEWALSVDADVLEMDVRPSADGQIMVIHDPTVDRTSNGTGAVASLTLSELKKLDFAWHFAVEESSAEDVTEGAPGDARYPLRGRGITIPTLGEVFDRFPDCYFSIDVKADDPEFAAKVIAVVMKRRMHERVIFGSFHGRIAELLRQATPPLFLAADRAQGIRLLLATRLGFPLGRALPDAYLIPDRTGMLTVATRRLIGRVHRAGRRCYFWTVDSEETMERLLRYGADGIITNRPDLLLTVRARLDGTTRYSISG